MKNSLDDLLLDLIRVGNILKMPPSQSQYEQLGQYNRDTIRRRFGTWNNGLKQAFNYIPHPKPSPLPEIRCLNCNNITKNPKFCSRSCSATYNNHRYPKRSPKRRFCICCGKSTRNRHGRCMNCYLKHKQEKKMKLLIEYGEHKISDFVSTYGRHKYQQIRDHAHRIAKIYIKNKHCAICDYPYTQLCHVKPIANFPKDTKLKIVNDPSNLSYLCRNHHWELDNQLLCLLK